MQTSLSFTMAVRKGADAVAFYKRAFEATEIDRMESPDGDVVVQLQIGQYRFFVADESLEHGNFSPESLGNRSSVRLALIVAEPDLVARQAVAAGAKEVSGRGPTLRVATGSRGGPVRAPLGDRPALT
jgi:PhnB protein